MNIKVENLLQELNQFLEDINKNTNNDALLLDVSNDLSSLIAVNQRINEWQKQLIQNIQESDLISFLSPKKASNLASDNETIDNINADLQKINEEVAAHINSIEQKKSLLQEIEEKNHQIIALQEQESNLNIKLADIKELESSICEQDIIQKQIVLDQRTNEYNQQKQKFDEAVLAIEQTEQEIEQILVDTQSKIDEKKRLDNFHQLEDDIKKTIDNFENNYEEIKKQSLVGLKYKLDFTKEVSVNLLTPNQKISLDKIAKLLDELDASLLKNIQEE